MKPVKRIVDTESQSNKPLHTELARIASLLKDKPAKPVKTIHQFIARLSLQAKPSNSNGIYVRHFLKEHLGPVIDHTITLPLKNGDVLIMTQPYHMPTQEEVARIESLGGFVLRPHADWGFHHAFCKPCVFLVPARAVPNFDLQRNPAPPRTAREVREG